MMKALASIWWKKGSMSNLFETMGASIKQSVNSVNPKNMLQDAIMDSFSSPKNFDAKQLAGNVKSAFKGVDLNGVVKEAALSGLAESGAPKEITSAIAGKLDKLDATGLMSDMVAGELGALGNRLNPQTAHNALTGIWRAKTKLVD